MKITIKLSAEEAQSFKNFSGIRPPDLPEPTFWKQIFLAGCQTMHERVVALMQSAEAQQALEAQQASEEQKEAPPVDFIPLCDLPQQAPPQESKLSIVTDEATPETPNG